MTRFSTDRSARRERSFHVLFLGFFWAVSLPLAAAADLDEHVVTIRSGENSHMFAVELAEDPDARTTGLMHRENLAEDAGMLFDFGRVQPVSMWMKNTLIPLDMLFIAEDGEIVSISHETIPGSLRQIASGRPVLAVLEIPGGRARQLGIRPGDRAIHAIFDDGA